MTAPFRAASLKPVPVECTPAPVLNILTSMAHLEDAAHMLQGVPDGYLTERPDELDAWLVEAAAQMSDEEHAFNRVLFRALGAVVLPEQEFGDFAAYLAALEASHPEALRNRALAQFRAAPGDILANFERYQGVVAERYPNDPPDTALLAEAYALLCTPEALHQRAVAHLRRLWNGLFAAEWKRREKALGALARVLAERQIPQASAPEIVRAVIGREPSPATTALLAQAERLVIVPTPHVSLYASSFHTQATVWVFVAVSTITSWALRQTPIKLSEVMVRVTPLSDETRLRILELLAQHGELSAQDLISMLDISQSSVSRHLKALGAYIVERRGEG
ncbi:MAG TPA: metalloregulator ArsR/SmtB family transcription factor, partial [Roseiflexaceae bacterium]|nr:metalloregulator ArsR/SmtB family transcription factor [Roseiflexaceae bacterium]